MASPSSDCDLAFLRSAIDLVSSSLEIAEKDPDSKSSALEEIAAMCDTIKGIIASPTVVPPPPLPPLVIFGTEDHQRLTDREFAYLSRYSSTSRDTYNAMGLSKILRQLRADYRASGLEAPWEEQTIVKSHVGEEDDDAKAYSAFPPNDEHQIDWEYYCRQETQMWSAKELDMTKDREEYPKLPPRYRKLYKDLLGFFVPSDGYITQSSLRFILELKQFTAQVFLIFQTAVEVVHSESYGMAVAAIIPDKRERDEVYQMINNLPCVQAKGQFIKDLIESDRPLNERLFAAACTEGIFFVTLFAIIFSLRSKGFMKTFIFLNKQVASDETLHRNYFLAKLRQIGPPPHEVMVEILDRALKIEIDHLAYILAEPIESVEADRLNGVTLENLTDYAKGLCDQIIVACGSAPIHDVEVELPFMADLSVMKRPNFYEVQAGGYKRTAVADAMQWRRRIGEAPVDVVPTATADVVTNPDGVDF